MYTQYLIGRGKPNDTRQEVDLKQINSMLNSQTEKKIETVVKNCHKVFFKQPQTTTNIWTQQTQTEKVKTKKKSRDRCSCFK